MAGEGTSGRREAGTFLDFFAYLQAFLAARRSYTAASISPLAASCGKPLKDSGEIDIMDDSKALGIVSALANGVNPLTGEVFNVDSPYQTADVIRALYAAVRALETSARSRTRGSPGFPRAGRVCRPMWHRSWPTWRRTRPRT